MKKWFFLLALFVVPAALFSAPHLALAGTCGGSTPCNCGDTVTSDYTLSDNLTCSLGANGLIVGSGVVLNGAGHSITGSTDVMPVIYNNRQYTYPTGKGSGVNAGSGSTIEGFSNITGFFYGIQIQTDGVTVQSNTISNSLARGISVQGNNNTISGNSVSGTKGDLQAGNNGGGIYINSGAGNVLSGNTLTGNYEGIVLYTSSPTTLTSNVVYGNKMSNYFIDFTSSLNQLLAYTIGTTNLSNGSPVYYLKNISDQTYDGGTLGVLGAFWCVGCTNVTLQNATVLGDNRYGPTFARSTNSTISNVTTAHNAFGIAAAYSDGVTMTGNTISDSSYGAVYVANSTTTISNNTLSSSYSGVTIANWVGTPASSVSGNTFSNILAQDISDSNSLGSYSNNTFSYPAGASGTLLNFTEINRTYSQGDTISFSANLLTPKGVACPSCTYSVVTYPAESVASAKVSNTVTGSFTPSQSGTYSLVLTVTDPSGNTAKKGFHFFVGDTRQTNSHSYLRFVSAQNGQTRGNGGDSQTIVLTPPSSNESWWCSGWTQTSIDFQPTYPLADITDVTAFATYRIDSGTASDGSAALASQVELQRYGTYSAPQNDIGLPFLSTSSLPYVSPGGSPFNTMAPTPNTTNFAGLNWTLDSLRDWYLLTLKYTDANSNPAEVTMTSAVTPSYFDVNYNYSSTVPIYSASNFNVQILSATAPSNATTSASIVLDNPNSTATSTTLEIPTLSKPFLGAGLSTITAGATTTITASIPANQTASLTAVPMNIIPSEGSIDVVVNSWSASDRRWSESSEDHSATTLHTVSGLTPYSSYYLTTDSGSAEKHIANASGVITFTFDGGYSAHTFDLVPDTSVPIVAITPSWINQTQRTSATGLSWTQITSSSDGAKQAAAEAAWEGGGNIWTSADWGKTWTNRTIGTPASGLNWSIITSDLAGTKLVAGVFDGDIWTSTDSGEHWTNRTGGTSASGLPWYSIASDSTGTNLAALTSNSSTGGDIWTSTDSGEHWTNRTEGTPAHALWWGGITSDSTGADLVAVVYGGDIWTSTDYGQHWINRTEGTPKSGFQWNGVASNSGGDKLTAAAYQGDIWTSTDYGHHWANQTQSTSASGLDWNSVAADSAGTNLVAVESDGTLGDIWASADSGKTWTNQTQGTSESGQYWYYSTVSSAGGSKRAATASGGDIWTFDADSEATTTTATTAHVVGYLSDSGGGAATERGFVYGASTSYGATSTMVSAGFSNGSFSADLSPLSCGTIYHYAAYAKNSYGVGYSPDATLTTSACPASTPDDTDTTPTVTPPSGGNGSASGPLSVGYVNTPVATPSSGSSLSTAQTQSILALLQSFNVDSVVLATVREILSSPGTAAGIPNTPFSFTKALYLAMHDPDVAQLQKLLVSLKLLPADSVTGYFGSATKGAVGTFQIKHHLVTSKKSSTYGYVGPKTRQAFNLLLSGE